MANSAALLKSFIGSVDEAVGGLRNKLINGRFDIWQRTTSFPAAAIGPFNGLVGFASDRWQWQANTDGGVLNGAGMTRELFPPGQPDVPENPTYFMRWQLTSITGSGGSAASNLVQRIESVRTLSGQIATLSFWMRGDVGGTVATSFLQFPGSLGTPAANAILPTNFTVTANTWTFHTLTFQVPSIAGFVIGAAGNDGLYVRFHNHVDASIATNQGFPTPISYTGFLDIANVQLEAGDIDDPIFEVRDLGFELQLCQRYYEEGHRDESNFGKATLTNEMWINYKVEKRIPPTVNFILREQGPTSSHLEPGYLVQFNFTDGFSIKYALSPLFAPFRDVRLSTTTDPGGGRATAPWTADSEL